MTNFSGRPDWSIRDALVNTRFEVLAPDMSGIAGSVPVLTKIRSAVIVFTSAT
jgi:hypothetical protein